MRRIAQFLFLLFYVASSYATNQERIRLIVSELYHSSSRDGQSQIDADWSRLDGSFPNYREAKPKAIGALKVVRDQNLDFLPQVSHRVFHIQGHSLKSLFSIECILDRAPPTLL
jgi:hypothetical protein